MLRRLLGKCGEFTTDVTQHMPSPLFNFKHWLFSSNSSFKTVLEDVFCCTRGVSKAREVGGLRLEVLAMLFKPLLKGRERGQWGLMKYLRFRPKKELWKKSATKGVCQGPPLCPGPRRKQGPSSYRYEEGPYWAGLCRPCSQLCGRGAAPATSPRPLWAFVRATERRFYTELIAQQRLCVGNKEATPTPGRRRPLPLLRGHAQTHTFIPIPSAHADIQAHSDDLRDDKVMNPLSVGRYELRRVRRGRGVTSPACTSTPSI